MRRTAPLAVLFLTCCATPSRVYRPPERRLVPLEAGAGCARPTCVVPQLPHLGAINAVEVTADGRTLFTGGEDGAVKQWDLESGLLVRTLRGHGARVMALATTADGSRLIVAWGSPWRDSYGGTKDEAVRIFDLRTGAVLEQLLNHGAQTLEGWPQGPGNADWRARLGGVEVHSGRALPDGRVAEVGAGDDGAWFVELRAPVGSAARAAGRSDHARYARPPSAARAIEARFLSAHVLQVRSEGVSRQLDLRTVSAPLAPPAAPRPEERPVWSLDPQRDGSSAVLVGPSPDDRTAVLRAEDPLVFQSRDGQRVAVASLREGPSLDRVVAVVDVARRAVLAELNLGAHDRPDLDLYVNGYPRRALAFVPSSYDLVRAGSAYVEVLDGRTLARKARLETGARPLEVETSPDGRFLAAVQDDGTVFVGRVDGGFAATLIFSRDEWLVIAPDGRFEASSGGSALAAATAHGRGFRLEQLALRDNRPDLLVEGLGAGSPEVVAFFRARVERRLAKAGLDAKGALEAALEAGARVSIRDAAPDASGAFVELSLELEHDTAPVRAYSVYVNQVRVATRVGPWPAGRKHRLAERVELVPGSNRVEVAALDARGVESLRAVRAVERVAPAEPEIWYLGYGVSRYRDARLDLAYARKDAEDLRAVFAEMQAKATHTKVYADEQVTLANLRAGKAFLAKAKANDVVVVFIAGHGVHAGPAADYYYLTHDADLARIPATAAPFEAIEDLFDGLTARQKLFLMDTCESGERDEDELAPLLAAAAPGTRARAVRGLLRKSSPEQRSARPFVFERDRYLFNDLVRRTGTVVFSSSRGDELSYELDEVRNGAFTHALRAALTDAATDTSRDGRFDVEELRAVVEQDVTTWTRGLQHPTIDRKNPEAAIGLRFDPSSEAQRLRAAASELRAEATGYWENRAAYHDAAAERGRCEARALEARRSAREERSLALSRATEAAKEAAAARTRAQRDQADAAGLEARAAALESAHGRPPSASTRARRAPDPDAPKRLRARAAELRTVAGEEERRAVSREAAGKASRLRAAALEPPAGREGGAEACERWGLTMKALDEERDAASDRRASRRARAEAASLEARAASLASTP